MLFSRRIAGPLPQPRIQRARVSIMSDLSSLVEANKTLAATNGALVQQLIDHEALLREHDELLRRFRHMEREARDRAAHGALPHRAPSRSPSVHC